MLSTILVEQERAVATAGDNDVAGATLLELLRIGQAVLGRLGHGVRLEDAADLVVVGLNEEGMSLDGLHEELAGRIDHKLDATTGETGHDLVVHVLGQGIGNGARKDEGVTGLQDVHAVEKLVDLLLRNLGAHAVDHGHDDAVELDVDARVATIQLHEVAGNARILELVDEVLASEARDNAHCHIDYVKLVEKRGDVNAVATAVELLARRTVGVAHIQREGVHHVVERGVQGHGVNQRKLLPAGYLGKVQYAAIGQRGRWNRSHPANPTQRLRRRNLTPSVPYRNLTPTYKTRS